MTTYQEAEPFILTTDANTNKNLTTANFSFTSASVNVPIASYQLRQYTISLSRDTRFYQIYVNTNISTWVGYKSLPISDLYIDSSRQVAVNISQSGSDITLNFYLINNSPGTINFPAFNINVTRRDFTDDV